MSIQLCGCCFPYPNQVQIQHDYFCCVTQQAKFPLSLIVILKQFIIKYEHFVQGQLHFTKTKIIQQKLLESDLQHELRFEITLT